MKSNIKIAFIGTGLMGRPMAEKLLEANYQLVVFNRTKKKAVPLKAFRAKLAESANAAIQSANCIILMLTDAAAIRGVLFPNTSSPDLTDRTIIQMSTISPKESISLQQDVFKAGGYYLEAPVLGSIPEAIAGKLMVMVGASLGQFEQWSGLLKCFGPEPLYVGPVGKAAALKLALNQLIASLTAAFSLSLGIVTRAEVDVNLFMKILSSSALYAPTFDKKLPRMLTRDFANPNFPTKHLPKDINLVLNEAKSIGLNIDGLDGVRRLVEKAIEKGFIDTDYSSLYNAVNPPE